MITLLFVTFAPLSSNLGHVRRLATTLEYLKKSFNIHILCLGQKQEDACIKEQHPTVSFYSYSANFTGWSISNMTAVLDHIQALSGQCGADLIILQMEVWDLMRELPRRLGSDVPVATVVHAMPFLGSPINPTKNFNADVAEFAESGIQAYRRSYILEHYLEAQIVLSSHHIIAANDVTDFYLRNYFSALSLKKHSKMALPNDSSIARNEKDYDLVYMARIEKGKGIGYIRPVLASLIEKIPNAKIRLAIMGKADDPFSRDELEAITSDLSSRIEVDFIGWADKETKSDVFSRSSVFIYPSYYDTCPICLIEALAHGLPAVVWDIPFTRICYEMLPSVARIPFNNIEMYVDGILRCLRDVDGLSSLSANYINSLPAPSEAAVEDERVFKEIIDARYN